MLHTIHGPLDGEGGVIYEQIARVAPEIGFISISMNQRKPKPHFPWVANCPNALDFSLYPVKPHRGDYLLFLGRMSPDKGCHRAIDVAVTAGLPLKIAGKNREPLERQYFDEFVAPHLSDQIQYMGEVTHGEKVELLQNARATLFPIEWEEPFGLVMIESMACGTPVIATRWGAVPEVIEHGRSGIIVDDYRNMAAAIEEADRLDPLELVRFARERFSPERMVADYLRAFRVHARRTSVVFRHAHACAACGQDNPDDRAVLPRLRKRAGGDRPSAPRRSGASSASCSSTSSASPPGPRSSTRRTCGRSWRRTTSPSGGRSSRSAASSRSSSATR